MAGSKNHEDDGLDGAGRSRRGLLAGAAGALGMLAAETVAPAGPAAAATFPPVLLGTDNTGATARTGIFTTNDSEWAQLADPGNAGFGSQGVYGAAQHFGVRGEAAAGTGVIGQGFITGGVSGTGIGVAGVGSGTGAGVTGTGGGAIGACSPALKMPTKASLTAPMLRGAKAPPVGWLAGLW